MRRYREHNSNSTNLVKTNTVSLVIAIPFFILFLSVLIKCCLRALKSNRDRARMSNQDELLLSQHINQSSHQDHSNGSRRNDNGNTEKKVIIVNYIFNFFTLHYLMQKINDLLTSLQSSSHNKHTSDIDTGSSVTVSASVSTPTN